MVLCNTFTVGDKFFEHQYLHIGFTSFKNAMCFVSKITSQQSHRYRFAYGVTNSFVRNLGRKDAKSKLKHSK